MQHYFHESHQDVLRESARMSEEDLNRPGRWAWTGKGTLAGARITGAMQLHARIASRLFMLTGTVLITACSAPAPVPPPGPGPEVVGGAAQVTPAPLPTRAITPRNTIAAEGALAALATPPLQLSFDSNARVTRVNAVAGRAVRTGEVLAEIDDGQLRDALQQARDQLALAEAQARQALAPALQTDLDTARANASAALARYNELKQGPSPSEIEQALRNWNQAKNALYSAQLSRDVECDWGNKPDAEKITSDEPDCKHAQYTVTSAELNEDVARLRYEAAQQPPGADRLAQAWADVASAQANLARLEAGAGPEQQQVSDIQLERSRAAVARAERNLARARLVSPCDCTVQQVDIAPGAVTAPGATAVTLLRLDDLRFRTSNLTERDVTGVRVGAPVQVRLRAFAQPFAGRVRALLPQSSGVQGGSALFTVIIELAPEGAGLLPGMTGEVEIDVAP